MDKIKKSNEELNAYFSRVYESPDHPTSFSGLDKLYCIAKKEFPSMCMIKIFRGGRGGDTSKPLPPYEQLLPLPTPCF